ncbi:MAG: hypothetical protein ACXW3D_04160 [Caulobacteraceae bacterium]
MSAANRPFKAYGPFELSGDTKRDLKGSFTEEVDWILAGAWGVYVLGIRYGDSYRVLYIGKTSCENGFQSEIFAGEHKTRIWRRIREIRGTPVVWLLAKPNVGRSGYCCDARVDTQAAMLETMMIMHAKAAKHKLLNHSKTLLSQSISVEGLFGAFPKGRGTDGMKHLRDAIF